MARCLEVEVTSQGESVEQARANLAEALALYFEDQPDALADAEPPNRHRSERARFFETTMNRRPPDVPFDRG